MPSCFPSVRSCSIAAGRYTSAATSNGRRPCLRSTFASFAAVVVLPEPWRPTRSSTVGGRSARASGTAAPPSISTRASWTIFTTCCAPVIDSRTFSPSARSRTVATSWRTTLKFTSASRSATRTSRSASSRSDSLTRARPRRRSKVVFSLSESCSNILLGYGLGRRAIQADGTEHTRQLIAEDLMGPEVSLPDIAAELAHAVADRDRLHSLGDRLRADRSRETDCGRDDGVVVDRAGPLDEKHRQLHHIEGRVPHVCEMNVALTEVVERDAESGIAE